MDNKEKRNNTIIISSMTVLSIIILITTYFLTREPHNEFIPVNTETSTPAGSWEENSGTENSLPTITSQESNQTTGSSADNTQSIISEDENGSTSNFSGSTTREDAESTRPADKPEATGDVSDPDNPPTYDTSVPQQAAPDAVPSPAAGSESGNAGQVYDPVFGWVDTGNTQQDNVDNDGDINLQIGTMGGN